MIQKTKLRLYKQFQSYMVLKLVKSEIENDTFESFLKASWPSLYMINNVATISHRAVQFLNVCLGNVISLLN